MDLLQQTLSVIRIALEKEPPDSTVSTWARRFCLGIDRTNESRRKIEGSWLYKSEIWFFANGVVLGWQHSTDPTLTQKVRDKNTKHTLSIIAQFYDVCKAPPEQYSL